MATATQQREIDGLTFEVTQLTGWKTLKMFRRLGAALGPAFATAAAGVVEGKSLLDLDIQQALPAISAAIPKLFEGLPESELEGMARGLLETATVNNPDNGRVGPLLPQFDLIMQGRLPTIFKLLVFAVEVNYGNFFDVAAEFARPHVTASRLKSSVASQPT